MHGRDPSAAGEGSAGSEPGTPETYDYEYERNGVSNRSMLFAPLEGWRRVDVTKRRTKVDWVQQIQRLVDEDYPDKRIVLVMDNFKHACSGFVLRGFEPAEARRIAERLEIHYTPRQRQLAEHGRNGDQCDSRPMPEPSSARPRNPTP